jgi:hypothetical protein
MSIVVRYVDTKKEICWLPRRYDGSCIDEVHRRYPWRRWASASKLSWSRLRWGKCHVKRKKRCFWAYIEEESEGFMRSLFQSSPKSCGCQCLWNPCS